MLRGISYGLRVSMVDELSLDHPNIVRLLDVLYDITTGSLALVLELMDMNVYEAIRGRK